MKHKRREPVPWAQQVEICAGKPQPVAVAECRGCRKIFTLKMSNRLPVEVIAKKFEQKGIRVRVGSKDAMCEDCIKDARQKPEVAKETHMAEITPLKPKTTETEMHHEIPLKQAREIMGSLEICFDEETGSYSDGYSDKRVAEEINVPVAFVVQVRREAFGELRRDPETDRLFNEIEKAQKTIETLNSRADQLAAEAKSYGKIVEGLRESLLKHIRVRR